MSTWMEVSQINRVFNKELLGLHEYRLALISMVDWASLPPYKQTPRTLQSRGGGALAPIYYNKSFIIRIIVSPDVLFDMQSVSNALTFRVMVR